MQLVAMGCEFGAFGGNLFGFQYGQVGSINIHGVMGVKILRHQDVFLFIFPFFASFGENMDPRSFARCGLQGIKCPL